MRVSGYRLMWLMVMFDLPTDTKEARREYTRFRKKLIKEGFLMLQFSVYGRPCPSEENAEVHAGRVQASLPPEGHVRVLMLTDKQFGRMKVFSGKKRGKLEHAPAQLEFF
ncbi:MAG: CRISPR-associated endonuclease Cas2 [Candidatus Lernaella stagnicola]|nr:CRISPR-associated endonuclease Cas2 [Candidatus Lernaella stagnicola]